MIHNLQKVRLKRFIFRWIYNIERNKRKLNIVQKTNWLKNWKFVGKQKKRKILLKTNKHVTSQIISTLLYEYEFERA